MSNNKQLVLIVYRFPPMGGIGSRRWAKFSKYLSRAGWQINVITTEYPWVDPINWSDDVENLTGLNVIRLPTGLPPIFLRPKSKSKVFNIGLGLYRRIFFKINREKMYLDYAGLWAEKLVIFASEYIRKEGVGNLVVSGPPSSLHLCGALIKAEVPSIRLILDYRDPWSNVHDVYMKSVGCARTKAQILKDEALALQVADKVVVVTQQMADELHQIFSVAPEKIAVICNGFDREDYRIDGILNCVNISGKIKVSYLGLFGFDPKGRLEALNLIAEALELLPISVRDRFEFNLYSDLSGDYFAGATLQALRDCVKCHAMVPHSGVADILAQTDICLSINRREDGHAFGTKIFDYMGAAKPIFQVTPRGELSELLLQAGQYVCDYNLKQIADVLQKIVDDYDSELGLRSTDSEVSSRFDLLVLSQEMASLLR